MSDATRVVVNSDSIRVISAGIQGPAGPPSLSPDGVITTEGDLIIGGTTGTPTTLPVGTVGQRLVRTQGDDRPSWQPDRVFDIGDYGASVDGTGDNTQAVLDAMAAADAVGGGTIWLPRPVDYLCTTGDSGGGLSWIIPIAQDNITFDGVPGSGLKTTADASLIHLCGAGKVVGPTNWASGWLHGGGSTPTLTPEAISSASAGADSITLTTAANAANYPVGSIIYIRTGHLTTSTTDTIPRAEMNIVTSSNSGTGVLGLKWLLSHDFAPENYPVGHSLAGTPTPFGVVNATDYVIQNVRIQNIKLTSTYNGHALMPEGQVIGLYLDDLAVQSAGAFQSLNNIRQGRYDDCDVFLNGPYAADNWFYTTATGSTDIEIINPLSTCSSMGNFHIHEGTVDVTIRGGRTRNKPGYGGSTTTIGVRAYCKNVNILNHRISTVNTGNTAIYVDETCDTGYIDGVTADQPISIGGPRWALGVNHVPAIDIYNNVSGGPIAEGAAPFQTLSLSGWVSDSNQLQVLGTLPRNVEITLVTVNVREAFNSSGTDLIRVGHDADPSGYAYMFDVSTTGNKTPAGGAVSGGATDYGSVTRIAQALYEAGGSAPTTGKALVTIYYHLVPQEIAT